MEITINTESRAAQILLALTHKAGTAEIYINTLSRIINAALFNQDDLGMSDTEALDTIRTLSLLRSDIEDIAADTSIADHIIHAQKNQACQPTSGDNKPDPYNSAMAALCYAAGKLGEIEPVTGGHGTDIIEIIEGINDAAHRLANTAACAAGIAENPDCASNEHNAEARTRLFTGTAYYSAVGAAELLADAEASLLRSGVKSKDLSAALYEAAAAQKAATEKIDRFRDLIYKAKATQAPQEGGDE
ncbi:hypothetical protein [Duncaniella muris]|uniref:hypothetical protein n=1 Tax=Duncaniella muris TaxID=2094150 RepID=UPI00259C7238|nr:hypothetical protein [Duncaniella muris]